MTLIIALLGAAALLGLAATAVVISRAETATRIVYTACLGIAAISLTAAAVALNLRRQLRRRRRYWCRRAGRSAHRRLPTQFAQITPGVARIV